MPSTLRRRVLAALTGTHQAQLLDPPTPDEIAEALRTLTKDALVYLVPATDDTPGTALVVTSKATVHAVPLPTLTEDAAPLKEYGPGEGLSRAGAGFGRRAGAVRLGRRSVRGPGDPPTEYGPGGGLAHDATGAPAHPTPRPRPRPRLAPHRPVLPPRPAGPAVRLGLVRGDAAAAGGLRDAGRAVAPAGAGADGEAGARALARGLGGGRAAGPAVRAQAAEISYAASARLLCQVAARPAAEHTGAALIVGNPTGDLRHAGEEADAVQRAFYPDARFLGRRTAGPTDGPGTPGEVLRWLRETPYDGAVLHLACHASVAENARRSAYLALHDGQLAAEEIAGAGGDRLGLVLLAACRSHVSGRGHNEAYSLATAFLAAGARSVVGSLWPVPDEATSVLMFLTHHFLRTHGEPPARALRRAQLWMLNPDRELPPELPEFLAERARRIDPHDLSAWAGFTHLGR
ncbi:CHAT domain-containing protein [Streptomyces diastatochromogenes]|nr:CHAT domain-containing protein [Streptomyces diastatochromogenes]